MLGLEGLHRLLKCVAVIARKDAELESPSAMDLHVQIVTGHRALPAHNPTAGGKRTGAILEFSSTDSPKTEPNQTKPISCFVGKQIIAFPSGPYHRVNRLRGPQAGWRGKVGQGIGR